MHEQTDVLVIGGGPAGATVAALLARQGVEVTLLERDRFPRPHIGESLLPSLLPILDVLGARELIERHGFIRKEGAFYGWGGQNWALRFDDSSRPAGYSFQVVRSEFDHLLLTHARQQGVLVREEANVRHIGFTDGRASSATWTDAQGTVHDTAFTHVVDASGRAGVLAARQLRSRRFHDVFRNVATWGYWRGAAPLRDAPAGAIGVFSLPEHGWAWGIPLHNGTLSVGLVTDKRSFNRERRGRGSVDEVYRAALGLCPALGLMLDGADLVGALRVESDYSYVSDAFCGPGWFLAGDAACFLDPLLSTGVHLAMYSGLLSAAALGSLLRGEAEEAEAQGFFEASYRRAYERLLILVSAFYQVHDGRDSYFRQAQELSHRDQEGLRLHESFLNIVTGVEDLADTQEDMAGIISGRLRRPLDGKPAQGLGGHGTSHMVPLPTMPEQAIGGWYLTLHPHLGLRRTP